MRGLLFTTIAAITLIPGVASAQSGREVRHDQRQINHDRRAVQRDVRRGHNQTARSDRRELRGDRRERREDWRDYRRTHRDVYHRNAYVGPRGWRYRPVAVGHRFAPAYYNRRYWINDPGRYRLPGPGRYQRWIRYGNDVVLIDMRNGTVLRVNNGFFW